MLASGLVVATCLLAAEGAAATNTRSPLHAALTALKLTGRPIPLPGGVVDGQAALQTRVSVGTTHAKSGPSTAMEEVIARSALALLAFLVMSRVLCGASPPRTPVALALCGGRGRQFATHAMKEVEGEPMEGEAEERDAMEGFLPYEGPTLPWTSLEAGCTVEDLGLLIAIGPSTLGREAGHGLYIAVIDGVVAARLPWGTPLCGYARGTMETQPQGDKSVAFAFDDLATPVFFDKQLLPLKDAVLQAAAASAPSEKPVEVTHMLYGHVLHDRDGEMAVAPCPEAAALYFIPAEPLVAEADVTSFGMFSNDFASSTRPPEELYAVQTELRNCLELVWRVAWDAQTQQLVPTWPVVIAARDLVFANRVAMEVGIDYGWRYWQKPATGESEETRA